MILVKSTDDFTINGIPHPNIPILANDNMEVVAPVLRFIVHQAIQNGRVQSMKTVESYASPLYDYFSFLEANDLVWNPPFVGQNNLKISNVALYRNWSESLAG